MANYNTASDRSCGQDMPQSSMPGSPCQNSGTPGNPRPCQAAESPCQAAENPCPGGNAQKAGTPCQAAMRQRQMENAQRQVANAQRQMANAQRQAANAQRQMANAQRQADQAQHQAANAQQQMPRPHRGSAPHPCQPGMGQRQAAPMPHMHMHPHHMGNCSGCPQTPQPCMGMDDPLAGMPIAMAYVPWQCFTDTYEPDKALQYGTIFPELNKPFYGKGGCAK